MMKKWIIIVLVVGMVGWAIYDFVDFGDEAKEAEVTETEEEVASEEVEQDETGNNHDIPESEESTMATIGLGVGQIAPDFELETLDGEIVKLSDFRGERVMVNFWATWCPPCRAEMPDIEKFYEDTDIVVLGVNLFDTESSVTTVKDFAEEYGLTFPILLDAHSDVATLYQIQPIPTSYMIDSNGKISNMAFGALTYELMVDEYMRME